MNLFLHGGNSRCSSVDSGRMQVTEQREGHGWAEARGGFWAKGGAQLLGKGRGTASIVVKVAGVRNVTMTVTITASNLTESDNGGMETAAVELTVARLGLQGKIISLTF
ncbi:hypothetical protein ACFE04_016580 [Oxalis oulophora]